MHQYGYDPLSDPQEIELRTDTKEYWRKVLANTIVFSCLVLALLIIAAVLLYFIFGAIILFDVRVPISTEPMNQIDISLLIFCIFYSASEGWKSVSTRGISCYSLSYSRLTDYPAHLDILFNVYLLLWSFCLLCSLPRYHDKGE